MVSYNTLQNKIHYATLHDADIKFAFQIMKLKILIIYKRVYSTIYKVMFNFFPIWCRDIYLKENNLRNIHNYV